MSGFPGTRTKLGAGIAAIAAAAAIGLIGPPVAAGASPDTCNSGNYWAWLQGSTFKLYLCGVGTRNLSGSDLYSELHEGNRSNRIWLHQHPDGSGWADCFRAANTTWSLNRQQMNPGNVQISSNTTPC